MNKKHILGIGLMALLASCGGNSKPETNELDPQASLQIKVLHLQDKEGHAMPNQLFYGEGEAFKAVVDSVAPAGSIPAAMGCFYVNLGQHTLFDAGLGARMGGGIDSVLAAAGLAPDSIGTIFITHCHGDHIGGLLNAEGKALYANADVYVPKVEYDYWMEQNHELVKMVFAAIDAQKLHVYSYADQLPLGVQAIAAPGHTPGHTLYRFGHTLIAGDFMHGMALQTQRPDISCDYDVDKALAAKTRKDILQMAADSSLTVYGMHLPGDGKLK